ncbi:MAG: ATP-binding cassette domain-containing protein [Anaerolineales bacterium]
MIEAEHLTKQFKVKIFKKIIAVNDASFTVNDGEVVGLLGPNGAGKTTMMRLLATVLHPTEGVARVDGFDTHTQSREVRRRLGILPETWGLYERFTPREHLRMFGEYYDIKKDVLENRIDELVKALDMSAFADRECKRFSPGMSQKVALARTLIHNPQNLLLDEPTNGLDVMSARQVRRLISQLREEKRCVMISTHILSEAERLCDRLILIDSGKVIAQGTPQEICERTGKPSLEDAFLSILGREDVEVMS